MKGEYKELFWYFISGITTAVVNIGLFFILSQFGVEYKISNVIAIICSKVYAFFTNKYLVFCTKSDSCGKAILEFIYFLIARGFTGFVDFAGVWLLIDVLKVDKMAAKYAVQFLVIVINYILGKRIVFVKR